MDSLLQDIRYGFRMLIHNPGFTAAAVIALALGIGGNSAIFSVVNAVLLKPLGYKDADRLVTINHNYPKLDLKASVSAVGYTHYRKVNSSFEDMAALTGWPANLTESGEPERLRALRVTPSFFPTLGVGATIGRVFSPDEDQPGREHVVVISDGLWRRRFGSDPGVVGRSIMLNGESYSVIGITPPGFQFGSEIGQPSELWSPIAFTPQQLQTSQWTNEYLAVFGRLKPNVTLEKAQAEFDTIAANVRQETAATPKDAASWNLLVRSFSEVIVGDIRPALLVLMAAVGLVLLIASANVANLLLARAAARQKEIAIRSALGAGRLRVIRQLLTESLLLAITGGAIGLMLGYWGVKLLVALNRDRIPRAQEISLDGWVVVFTVGISILTGIVFGLVPALQSSRSDLHETLKEGGRSGSGGTRRGLRGALVVAEIALALMLLVGAGLLIKSFIRLQQIAPGFQPQNVLVMQLSLPNLKYRDPAQVDGFYERLLEKVKAIPGVKEASTTTNVPLSGSNSSGSFQIENRPVPPGQMSPWGSRTWVGSNYFKAMGIPLIKGRFFDDHDVIDAPGAAIIDETMARKFWADEDPVGKRITFEGSAGQPRWREIVGVVGHVKQRGLEGESPVQYYVPLRQRPLNSIFLAVRTSSDTSSLAPSVRGAIRSLDPELPVFNVTSMEQLVSDSMAQRRFSMFLFGIFAAVALVLASVGLSGVMAYSVTQRTHEIGIRMALGASRGQVLRLVVGQGMLLSAVGLGLGIVAALGATRLMAKLLFGVGATDPSTFVIIALLLAVVALVASYLPARLATKVDPMNALRYE
jgi:putative ABC transport system permease protein